MFSKCDLSVKSTIVKKVRLEHNLLLFKLPYIKYRYFFDIHNNGVKDFDGIVTIWLYSDKLLIKKTFTPAQPIHPNQSKPLYLDMITGPRHMFGKYGIRRFSYVVDSGSEVASGQERISEKYEDLS